MLVGAPAWARRRTGSPIRTCSPASRTPPSSATEGRPNPAAYTELLNKASARMAEVDPGANRIGAALAQVETKGGNIDPREFLKRMYALGAGPNMTAVSVHPYCFWYRGSCPAALGDRVRSRDQGRAEGPADLVPARRHLRRPQHNECFYGLFRNDGSEKPGAPPAQAGAVDQLSRMLAPLLRGW
jgi:hypothetical protein